MIKAVGKNEAPRIISVLPEIKVVVSDQQSKSKARVMPTVPSSLKRYDTIKISLADKMVCQVKVPSFHQT